MGGGTNLTLDGTLLLNQSRPTSNGPGCEMVWISASGADVDSLGGSVWVACVPA